jgi:DinB family protein
MMQLANDLRSEIDSSFARLRKLSESDATRSRGPGKWIRKQILGHLIDSASNNHQRFLRAQFEDPFVGPGYDQDVWVAMQRYKDRPWTELIEIWVAMNRQVAHAMESVPDGKLRTRCIISKNEPVTLEFVMQDYLVHMRHHLAQIFES